MSQEDRAQEEEAFHWELINSHRQAAKEYEPGDEGYGPELCRNSDCEADMPELRRRRGCQFCTECQTRAEQKQKRGY